MPGITSAGGPPVLEEREFAFLKDLIMQRTGIFLSEEKRSLIEGRLAKRLRHLGMRRYADYVALLQGQDPSGSEALELINAVTTNKTSFFRESHHFDYLRTDVFPRLAGRTIRIWSAGCSSGEEPYSIAMAARDANARVEIFATDVDTNVLATARAGVYRAERVSELPQELLRRHFQRGTGEQAGLYRVRPELQQVITFERLNFAEPSWPSGAPFDVIFCRNVVIYFNRPTQERLFRRFAERLAPGGAMIIGHSENLSWLPELFQAVGKTIYRRAGGPPVDRSVTPNPVASSHPKPPPRKLVRIEAGGVFASRAPAEVRTVLGSCIAACVYDSALRVGGMNHFMLPEGESVDRPARYGVNAMELLINEVMKLGGERARLRAKVFGAGNVVRGFARGETVGRKNAAFIRAFLRAERIPIEAEQLEGEHPLEVRFDTDTAKARVRAVASEREAAIWRAEQQIIARQAVPLTPDVDVDSILF